MADVPPLIAIDVAILPPPEIVSIALALSAALPRSESRGLLLDASHLPHVTLTQQFIPVADLPRVTAAVGAVLHERKAIRLRVSGPARGSNSVWMQIERTAALDDLHRALMGALLPFEQRRGALGAFVDGDARPDDVRWVTGFRRHSSDRRYTPHVTLGHASQPPSVEPMTFDAETVAMCHLGRFCACREVLRSWTLTAP